MFKCSSTLGKYHCVVQEMKQVDHSSFYTYFHMSPVMFDDLLIRVGPVITQMTSQLTSALPPGERLGVTLRYLVTGDSMKTISGYATVCCIIKDTCQALWDVLSPEFYSHLKVVRNGKRSVMASIVLGTSTLHRSHR